ncbi:MAG: hypothetical protein R2877_08650 [Bdellovibrionota bacterium]
MKHLSTFLLIFVVLVGISTPSHAQRIRFNLGGAKFLAVAGQLSVTITVDATTPAVTIGTAPDQMFRDDSVGAAFFGYYLTTALRTQQQANGTQGYVQLRVGSGATANRTYYLLGNGTTTPTLQSQLTAAPAAYTTIASIPRNSIECGTNYAANGLGNTNGVNCNNNPSNDAMDVTQFVKVLFTDAPTAIITSQLQFAVTNF